MRSLALSVAPRSTLLMLLADSMRSARQSGGQHKDTAGVR